MGEEIQRVSEFFKALSDLSRSRLIRILSSCGQEQYCVADLAKKLGITQPAVSQRLKVLRQAGIVKPRKIGFRVYYAANRETLQARKTNMDALCKLSEVPCPANATCENCPGAFCPLK